MKIEFEEKVISLLTPSQKLLMILLAKTYDPLDQKKSFTDLLACVKKITNLTL